MKLLLILTSFLSITLSSSVWAGCVINTDINIGDSKQRLYHLQDAVDDCEDLSTLTPLIHELIKQGKYKQANTYLEIAKDYSDTSAARSNIRLLKAHYYLAQDNVCQVHQLINTNKTHQQNLSEVELALHNYQQTHPVASKDLSCMLNKSRSIANSRGLKRTNSINMAIAFETNSAMLSPKGKIQVEQLAKSLNSLKLTSYKVNFVGHTDLRGMESYNMSLSAKRAMSVYKEVINHQPTLINAINYYGKGETQPKVLKQSEQAHQINRRVEVFLSKD